MFQAGGIASLGVGLLYFMQEKLVGAAYLWSMYLCRTVDPSRTFEPFAQSKTR